MRWPMKAKELLIKDKSTMIKFEEGELEMESLLKQLDELSKEESNTAANKPTMIRGSKKTDLMQSEKHVDVDELVK